MLNNFVYLILCIWIRAYWPLYKISVLIPSAGSEGETAQTHQSIHCWCTQSMDVDEGSDKNSDLQPNWRCQHQRLLEPSVWAYSKTCVKQPLKIDKTKNLITNGSLMKVESIAECSPFCTLLTFMLSL